MQSARKYTKQRTNKQTNKLKKNVKKKKKEVDTKFKSVMGPGMGLHVSVVFEHGINLKLS